ncbi:response regulator transcription factor [Salipiger abyssi]|uniref:response regulator transcription factor n=1 Tax=Salipiger abyssi TaxID=1250539 RepID=UPI004057F61A
MQLTRRERQILKLVSRGLSSKEIAAELGVSPKTVEFHRSNLLRKFHVRSAAQLVSVAADHLRPRVGKGQA